MPTYDNSDVLYHHGVKGMKWGVRRYQRSDGSLTAAGKKRYQDSPSLSKQRSQMKSAESTLDASKKAYRREDYKFRYVPFADNQKELIRAREKVKTDKAHYRRAKLKYETNKEVARIKDENVEFQKKSKHRLRLEEQYRQMGMDALQAEAAANNRIRTEKILAASAALTVAACGAYIANKKMRDRIDGVIKAGESLQRIEGKDTNGKLHSVFYASSGKHDAQRYKHILGVNRAAQTGHAYMMELEAASNVRVASRNNAAKVFGELYKNDTDFKKSVQAHVGKHFGGGNAVSNVNDMSTKNIRKMYDNFNANLARIQDSGSGADKTFFNKMKSAGYGAVQDINDMKYSGYNAKKPFIVFDNSNKNIMVKNVREITGELLGKRSDLERYKMVGETSVNEFLKLAGPLSAATLTAATVNTYRSDPNDEYDNQGGTSKWS